MQSTTSAWWELFAHFLQKNLGKNASTYLRTKHSVLGIRNKQTDQFVETMEDLNKPEDPMITTFNNFDSFISSRNVRDKNILASIECMKSVWMNNTLSKHAQNCLVDISRFLVEDNEPDADRAYMKMMLYNGSECKPWANGVYDLLQIPAFKKS